MRGAGILLAVLVCAETSARIRQLSVAVRTESGKPLAYLELLESHKARLFTAASCVPD